MNAALYFPLLRGSFAGQYITVPMALAAAVSL